MQFSTAFLAAALAATALGKFCTAGFYGECEYSGTDARCATKCFATALGVDCECPQTLNGFNHESTGCITLVEYNDRHHC